MSKDKDYDKVTFNEVLAAVRGGNPDHSSASAKDKQRARDLLAAQKKHLRKKFNSKQNGGDPGSVDTGMFSS